MNSYIHKNKIPTCPTMPNMSNYILKSEIPSCPKQMDLSKFVLKSSVPPPIKCPSCPACPSPCKKVRKIVTCKKQPLVCRPANSASSNTYNNNILKNTSTKTSNVSKKSNVKNSSRSKVSSSNKQNSSNISSKGNNEIRSQGKKTNGESNLKSSQNQTGAIKVSTSIQQKSSVATGDNTLQKLMDNNFIQKKRACKIPQFKVKKNGVYGPY